MDRRARAQKRRCAPQCYAAATNREIPHSRGMENHPMPPLIHQDEPVNSEPVTVGIVEDDPVLRECLSAMIDDVDGFTLIGTATNVRDGHALLATSPDILLLDLGLSDGTGLDIIARARDVSSPTRIVVLTVFADVRSVVRAIEEGADGYLLKESDSNQIVESLRIVLAGGAPISPAVASHILARMRSDNPRSPSLVTEVALTGKETAVLEALASGKAHKEVAAKLGISTHTVGDHVKSIYRKLSVNSRGEAVYKAIQTGLISVDRN